ncbi:MAG: hypothetical protein JF615_00410 [Asticcacaulis sp.]|nr:hypothetical protein [Asticcacaulis sp.]
MTDFQAKKQTALDVLAATGIWRSNYAPPLSQLMWRLGVQVRPPHFNGFLANFLTMGLYFGIAMGAAFYFLQPVIADFDGVPSSSPVTLAVLSGAIAGAVFGLAMASYYAYGAAKFRLPAWNAL